MNAATTIKILNALVSVGTAIGVYFGSVVLYPSFSNNGLLQTGIDHSKLSIVVMVVLIASVLILSNRYSGKKYTLWYLLGAIVLSVCFFLFLFRVYYPYVNKKIIRVEDVCKASFFAGDEFRGDLKISADSARSIPAEQLIGGADCDPGRIWTQKSIEKSYSWFMANFIVTIFLFTGAILLLIQSVFSELGDRATG